MAYDIFSAGFDELLNRGVDLDNEILDDESSIFIRQLSGSSMQGGLSRSQDGKLQIDWEGNTFLANDGSRNRVEIGKIPGTELFGIRIYDASGNEIFSAAGELQSSGIADGAVTTTKIANLAVTTAKIESLTANKLTTGTLSATTVISVGDDNVIIDGENKRIIVNDGTDDRVIIGFQEGGF